MPIPSSSNPERATGPEEPQALGPRQLNRGHRTSAARSEHPETEKATGAGVNDTGEDCGGEGGRPPVRRGYGGGNPLF
ncbi:hypothetical protein SCARD494_11679 [Seiridium cardinale]